MCFKALSQILHKHISAANRPMPKPRARNIEHKLGLNVDVGVVAGKRADTNSDRPVNLFVSQRCLKRAVSRPSRRSLRRPLTESRANNVTLHNNAADVYIGPKPDLIFIYTGQQRTK